MPVASKKNVGIAKSKMKKETALGAMGVWTRLVEINVEIFLLIRLDIAPSSFLIRLFINFFLANLMSSQVSQSAQRLFFISRALSLPSATRILMPSLKEFLPWLVVFFRTSKM